jgi:hypothetical protein
MTLLDHVFGPPTSKHLWPSGRVSEKMQLKYDLLPEKNRSKWRLIIMLDSMKITLKVINIKQFPVLKLRQMKPQTYEGLNKGAFIVRFVDVQYFSPA